MNLVFLPFCFPSSPYDNLFIFRRNQSWLYYSRWEQLSLEIWEDNVSTLQFAINCLFLKEKMLLEAWAKCNLKYVGFFVSQHWELSHFLVCHESLLYEHHIIETTLIKFYCPHSLSFFSLYFIPERNESRSNLKVAIAFLFFSSYPLELCHCLLHIAFLLRDYA